MLNPQNYISLLGTLQPDDTRVHVYKIAVVMEYHENVLWCWLDKEIILANLRM